MIRIAQEDGSFLKLIRRKKRKSTGRKRGRPRKVVTEKPKPSRKRPYSIILTTRGRQKECFKTFKTEEEAYQYFTDIINSNQNVRFPVKYLNYAGIVDAKYEIYIIKRVEESETKFKAQLRNDYGEFIEYDTDSDNWMIVDKSPWNVEESFWVHGYDPVFQRKDFNWIVDNIIIPGGFKNILVYKNKFIIDTSGEIDIVFCKNMSDAFRLYTEIEDECRTRKIKSVMFSGNISDYSRATVSSWKDKLCEVTGFNRKKISRSSLRP